MSAAPTTVVFDLGNVLLDWDPRTLFARLIEDPDELDHFLGEVCTRAWHDAQDRGRPAEEAIAELAAKFPEYADLIAAYYARWPDMTTGAMPACVDIVRELRGAGIRLVALTNWPADTFEPARDRFPFFAWFEGIVVSGQEGIAKPDEEIFRRLLDRYDVDPATAVYVDDTQVHVDTASRLGMTAFRYRDAASLRRDLAGTGLPVAADIGIRPATADDLAAIDAIYNHYVRETVSTFDVEPMTTGERATWFSHYAASGSHRLLVATREDRVVGYAASSRFRPKPAYDPSVEVTVYLSPDATGHGVGSLLYQQLFAELRSEPVHRAYAAIAQPNPASEALHRRFAFQEVGTLHEVGRKHGRWVDVLWMQRPVP
ncbi:MAG TPA: GNAT family N-acetyltransferase [Mycobacteriales bacterium]|nr:GNAT family N-acetyltransferase [Mycobacteriales bacterium]